MVLFEYNNINRHKTGFTGSFYASGYIIPSDQNIVPISVNWNAKTIPVQFITYNTYSISFDVRDSEYERIQDIQYAYKIIAYENDKTYQFEILEFSSEVHNEFWKITLKFRDIESKSTENVIKEMTTATFPVISVWNQDAITSFSENIKLDVIQNVIYNQVLADDFQDRIIDYNKLKEYFYISIFLTGSELHDFYISVQEIGSFSVWKFKYDSYNYSEFEIEHSLIGEDLYQVKIKLFFNNRTILPEANLDILEVIIYDPENYIKHE